MSNVRILFISMVLLILLSVVIVQAGYLTASRSFGSSGTTFTVSWYQGCGPNCDVKHMDGSDFNSVNLNLGPNSCNSGANPGNIRAILCLIGSDVGMTTDTDAVLDCDRCPCEPVPNTNFRCLASGVCEQCNACDDDPCPYWWQSCTHNTCTTRTCDCDDDACYRNGACNLVDSSHECGNAPGNRDERRCRSNSCTTESASCTVSLGSCPSGQTCENNVCVSSYSNTCTCEQEQYGTGQYIVVDEDCSPDRTAVCTSLGGCNCVDW